MTHPEKPLLLHHRLVAFHVAVELLVALREAQIRDSKLRDESLRAAKSVCCNIAECAGAAREQERGHASGSVGEAVAAVG